MSHIDPTAFRAALERMHSDAKVKPAHGPLTFIGLSGIGCVCPSEYRDIVNRTGPYAKGGPLDLGDAYYQGRAGEGEKK